MRRIILALSRLQGRANVQRMVPGFYKLKHLRARKRMGDGTIRTELVRLLSILLLIICLHTVAMVHFEKMPIEDALWLTMTSATTVGYGDLSAQTGMGRTATIMLLYIGGIAILAQVAALYFEYRQEIRDRMLKGNWSWNMEDHIVFLNCPQALGEEYFYHAISGLRSSNEISSQLPIIIVSEHFSSGLPHRLRELDVVHVSKPLSHRETLESAAVTKAHTVVVLSRDAQDPASDGVNFDLVDRLREMGVKGQIIAEVVQDENRPRLKKVGADSVLRPIRSYPELLTRTILAPGAEQVIETLFDSKEEECLRYNVAYHGNWGALIHRFTDEDKGIPIAYEDYNGVVFNSPSAKKQVEAQAIFVIVNVEQHQGIEVVKRLVNG